jgi:DNA-binding Xre family transcriptional regulator
MPIVLTWSEIERLMELRGIRSRDALAASAQISKSTLYKMSKGLFQPSMTNLGKICQVLRCQPGDLLQFVYEDEATAE